VGGLRAAHSFLSAPICPIGDEAREPGSGFVINQMLPDRQFLPGFREKSAGPAGITRQSLPGKR
jgi:hypothetical protein